MFERGLPAGQQCEERIEYNERMEQMARMQAEAQAEKDKLAEAVKPIMA